MKKTHAAWLRLAATLLGALGTIAPAAAADPAACLKEAPRLTFEYWPPGTSVVPGKPAMKELRAKYPRYVEWPASDAERVALHDIYWPSEMSARFTIRQWVMSERFDCLEEAFRDLEESKARFPDGEAKVIAFLSAMPEVVEASNGMTEGEIDALVKRWRSAQPASLLPELVWPRLLNAAAWQVRGEDTADRVPAAAMLEFKRLNATALTRSKAASARAQAHLLWHYVTLRVLGTSGTDTSALDAMTVAALKRFPDDLSLALPAGSAHLPEWGGSQRQFEAYAEAIRKVVGEPRGDQAYAMLYTRLVRLPAMLRHDGVRMDVVRRGLVASAESKGAGPIQLLQSYACATRDAGALALAQRNWADYARRPQLAPPATELDATCRAWQQTLPPH